MPAPAAAARRRATQLAAQIAALGFALPGTVASRYTRCGKPGCRCTASPPALHGPYLTWTRKAAGKTVTRRLTEDQYQACRPWFDASHTLRALLAELEALSLDTIEDELRPGHGKATTSQPRKTPAT
jgi:hypothetical protein